MAVIFFLKYFRTKIQAQRKFAQGQQPPSSAYLSYNLTSGSETPVKEKSQERELLPNHRPNTEDFLTFLCFRGTNSLPKELDFQNTLNEPSTSGTSERISKNPDKNCRDAKTESKKKFTSKKTETVTSMKEKNLGKVEVPQAKDPKTGFMPFAVRKRAEIHPIKNNKKKLQQASRTKQQEEPAEEKEEEALSKPKAARGTPVAKNTNEVRNVKDKKINKRKSAVFETQLESQCKNTSEISIEVLKKDTKKSSNKTASKIENDKRQTRLSAIKHPSSSTPKEIAKNGNESSELEKYFSSDDDDDDDDEPLIKAEPKNKKAKLQEAPMPSFQNSSINKTKSQDNPTTTVKSNRGRKKKALLQSEPEQVKGKTSEIENSSEKIQVVRKKKLNVDLEIANSQANTTDLSENDTRGRPMRKTKEAATIYMELIGRKLTLQDSSDNDSSLDSLEVPNLKRVELLENELKANCEKAKEAEAEKKKKADSKVSFIAQLYVDTMFTKMTIILAPR